MPDADPSITAELAKNPSKADSVVLKVSGLGGKIQELKYELEYDSEGLIKGVNSGNSPLDVSGQDSFEREIYLGTCSKNVCTPDKGVRDISVLLIFTDTQGSKSKLTKDISL